MKSKLLIPKCNFTNWTSSLHAILSASVLIFSSLAIQAQSGEALLFDGVDDHVTLPNTGLNSISNGDFTVEAWVRGLESEQGLHARIFSNRASLPNEGFLFHFVRWNNNSDHMMLTVSYGINNHFLIDNGLLDGPILDGSCHHVAVTKTGSTLEFFVDGLSIGTAGFFGSVFSTVTNNQSMTIGTCSYDPQPFNGNISNVRIWNYARSQSEIEDLMNVSIIGGLSGLVANWGLQDGSGQLVTDASLGESGVLGGTETVEPTDPLWTADGCVLNATTIQEEIAAAYIQSYPNPATDLLSFQFGNRDVERVRVIDVAGRLVKEEYPASAANFNLVISDLISGSYIVLLETDQGAAYSKFLKQ